MKRLLGAIGVAVSVVLLTSGCGYKAESGYVIEKEYSPEESGYHWVTTTQCSYNYATKTNECKPVQQYQYYYYPECYKIRVEDEKEHRGSWCVSESTYNSTNINDYFDAKAGK